MNDDNLGFVFCGKNLKGLNIGAGGGPPPGESRNVCKTVFTSPQRERIITKPITPQRTNCRHVARSVSLLAPKIKYLKTPQRKTINAIAIRTGTRIPLITSMIPFEYGLITFILMPPGTEVPDEGCPCMETQAPETQVFPIAKQSASVAASHTPD